MASGGGNTTQSPSGTEYSKVVCGDSYGTVWPIVFQSPKFALIFTLKVHYKVSSILLKIGKSRRTSEVSRAATESAILFQPR
jgi:hypothetical protein